jgi:hypothetical protein
MLFVYYKTVIADGYDMKLSIFEVLVPALVLLHKLNLYADF